MKPEDTVQAIRVIKVLNKPNGTPPARDGRRHANVGSHGTIGHEKVTSPAWSSNRTMWRLASATCTGPGVPPISFVNDIADSTYEVISMYVIDEQEKPAIICTSQTI